MAKASAAAEKEVTESKKEPEKHENTRRQSVSNLGAAVLGAIRQRRVKAQRDDEQRACFIPNNHPVLMGDVIVLENIDSGTPGFLVGKL